MSCSVDFNQTPTGVTHDATPVNIIQFEVPDGQRLGLEIKALATSENGNTAFWRFYARVVRNGTITIMAQLVDTTSSKDAAALMWDCYLDVSGSDLTVKVKGGTLLGAALDVNWHVEICGVGMQDP